jgi:hypothetical protein
MEPHNKRVSESRIIMRTIPPGVEQQAQADGILRSVPPKPGEATEGHNAHQDGCESKKQAQADEETTKEELTIESANRQSLVECSIRGPHLR